MSKVNAEAVARECYCVCVNGPDIGLMTPIISRALAEEREAALQLLHDPSGAVVDFSTIIKNAADDAREAGRREALGEFYSRYQAKVGSLHDRSIALGIIERLIEGEGK